jgi:hypothetical protein
MTKKQPAAHKVEIVFFACGRISLVREIIKVKKLIVKIILETILRRY